MIISGSSHNVKALEVRSANNSKEEIRTENNGSANPAESAQVKLQSGPPQISSQEHKFHQANQTRSLIEQDMDRHSQMSGTTNDVDGLDENVSFDKNVAFNNGDTNVFSNTAHGSTGAIAAHSGGEANSLTDTTEQSVSHSENGGPDGASPVDPTNSTAPSTIDPPYRDGEIVEMNSGHFYYFEVVSEPGGDSITYEITRVNVGDNSAPMPWVGEIDNGNPNDAYDVSISGFLKFDLNTGALQKGGLSLKNIDTDVVSGHANYIAPGTKAINAKFMQHSDFVEDSQMLENLNEFFFRSILQIYDRGDVEPGSHPDDIDIGPNGPPAEEWAGGSGGGGGSAPSDTGGIDGAGDFGTPEGSEGYGDGTGIGSGGTWTGEAPPKDEPEGGGDGGDGGDDVA